MLRSEWTVFADSVAGSLASSIGGNSPHILRRTQTQQLPPTDSSLGGLVLASTMFLRGCRICVVAGLSRVTSSISTGSVYVAEAGLLMTPLVQSRQHSPSLAVSPAVPSPILPQNTPLSVFFALRGR